MPKSPDIGGKRQVIPPCLKAAADTQNPAQPCALGHPPGRTHHPLAMQKVVGSNPIIRFARSPLQRGRFSRLAGRS
jgi:hypothetical protein